MSDYKGRDIPTIEVYSGISENDSAYDFIDRKIYVEDGNLSEVGDWVKILEVKNEYTDPNTGKVYVGEELERHKKGNPIQFAQ